jgi:ABC-type nickel/cobalt efflux system permease component RcnA
MFVAAVAGFLLMAPGAASAHPLGNFTVNTYAGLHLVPGEVRVEYVVDMAEIPTFQALPAIDTNHDGVGSSDELIAWAKGQAPQLVADLSLRVDGREAALAVGSSTATYRPGQGGLSCLRLEATFSAPVSGHSGSFSFTDRNFEGHVGWREVTAVGEDGERVSGSSVPTRSISDALLSYPQDLLSSPLHVTSATARFAPGASVGSASVTDPASGARPLVESGAFAALIQHRGLPLVALAFLLAIAFGAWHALLPGHGKTLMAAYMVGAGSRARQAVAVGTAVAVMHTASVLALGLLVLTLEQTFRPEALYPWLGLLSGLVALGLGAALLITRIGGWMASARHDAAHEHGHDHTHEVPAEGALSRRGLLALALAGGILPAPSALLVLLASIEAHRVLFGLSLVVAFSAGLATALIAVGLGVFRLREALGRRMSSMWARLVPVVSASAIVGFGIFYSVRGLTQI